MKLTAWKALGLLSLWFLCSAQLCTKVIAYGTKTYTDPQVRHYSTDMSTALNKAQKALEGLGYEVTSMDEARNQIVTGWKPVTSDSHYFKLFNRRDYAGADGAYYQIVASASQTGSKIEVSVSTMVTSMAGKLESSHVLEEKILRRLDDLLRSPQIEMTNVGVKER